MHAHHFLSLKLLSPAQRVEHRLGHVQGAAVLTRSLCSQFAHGAKDTQGHKDPLQKAWAR